MSRPGETVPARVMITDGDSRAALAAARSLIAAGYEVWAVGPGAHTLAGVSRGVQRAIVRSSALFAPASYAAELGIATVRHQIDVLLPVSDASATAVLMHPDFIPPSVAVPLPSPDTFRRGGDKTGMLDVARTAGFDVPVSVLLENRGALDAALPSVAFPAILKPHHSVVIDNGRGRKLDVEFIPSAEALRAAVDSLPACAFPVLVQQRVMGAAEGIFALRWDGRLRATFAHRRLREKPPAGGISVYRESIAVPPDLRAKTDALLTALDWQGVAMVECKVDRATGRHSFIELNGRLWGSLQLAIDAGVDFPALLVDCALGRDEGALANAEARTAAAADIADPPYEVGVRSRWFWGDLDHLWARFAHSADDLHLEPPFPSRAEILRDVLRVPFSRDRAEVGRWGDPLPALLEGLRRILPMRPAEHVVEGVEEPLGARTTAKPFIDRERRTAPTSEVLSIAAFKHRRDRRSIAR